MKVQSFLTIEEVAVELKASVKTVRRRIAAGSIRAFKEGGRVCVLESDLADYLQRQIHSTATR